MATVTDRTPVEVEQERLEQFERQDEERKRMEKSALLTRCDKVREKLLAGRKLTDSELPIGIPIQAEIVSEAKAKQAAAANKAKFAALEKLAHAVTEPLAQMRAGVDTVVPALTEARPALRAFYAAVKELGLELPASFVNGAALKWGLDAQLFKCWPGLFSRPGSTKLQNLGIDTLTTANVETALESARRKLEE